MNNKTIQNVILMGVAAYAGYMLVRSLSANAGANTVNGFSVQGTDGKTYNLQQQRDGYIYDQFGGMWT